MSISIICISLNDNWPIQIAFSHLISNQLIKDKWPYENQENNTIILPMSTAAMLPLSWKEVERWFLRSKWWNVTIYITVPSTCPFSGPAPCPFQILTGTAFLPADCQYCILDLAKIRHGSVERCAMCIPPKNGEIFYVQSVVK